jgi:8-oxo-dGTP pyrophosphatase MutT (NUDIX family)
MVPVKEFRNLLRAYRPNRIELSEYPDFTPAAVLVPLFESEDGLSIILTKRTDSVDTHKGQIAFPGGMKDETDVDLTATALRETQEELGIDSMHIDVLGTLDEHPVPSGFIITPVVAFLDHIPKITPHSAEVAEVFDIPLSFFANDNHCRMEEREFRGVVRKVWFYSFGKHTIWGATAAIIRNLLAVLSPSS